MRAAHVLLAGSWDKKRERGTATLDWDERHRRRRSLTSDQGEPFLLDLAEAARLADGDGLALEDGSVIRVVAKQESVLEIRAGTAGLARLAYHLGNRHLAIQIFADRLVIREDAVIAAMVDGLGGVATRRELPFDPEGGAYDGHATHGHNHHHNHDRHHEHGHAHGHGHGHG
ncbi:urease accessory protein UreE [Methylosinus sp. H3A]|uniref:urease accessory protein UreE n=1 Tax=Methylosinus sp. H3A TaxID=2785786 RepID=UPI0018C316AE|nr:urease accessory protein UreE [Methylosinus sp. H3A]MBG0811340.1 urease accessory protein UreE [Methylosinus sp. H3A]